MAYDTKPPGYIEHCLLACAGYIMGQSLLSKNAILILLRETRAKLVGEEAEPRDDELRRYRNDVVFNDLVNRFRHYVDGGEGRFEDIIAAAEFARKVHWQWPDSTK